MTPLGSSTAILVSDILPALIHVLFKKALSTAWIVADWIIVAVTAVLMVILTDISFKELVSSL